MAAARNNVLFLLVTVVLFLSAVNPVFSATPKFVVDFGQVKNYADYADGKFSSYSDFYSVCEGSRYVIPVKVSNVGDVSLAFTFSSDSEKWVRVPKSLKVGQGQSNIFFVSISPPENSKGTYVADVFFNVDKYDAKVKRQIPILVEKCVSLEILPIKYSDKACSCRGYVGNFSLVNSGDRGVSARLSLAEPDWIWMDLNSSFVFLPKYDKEDFLIRGEVPCNLSGNADVSIKTVSNNFTKYFNFTLDVLDSDECSVASFSGEDKHVFSLGSPVSVLYLTNNGADKSSYVIKADSGFVSVSPSEVALEPDESVSVRIRLLDKQVNESRVRIFAVSGNSSYFHDIVFESKEGKIFSSGFSGGISSFAESFERFFNYYRYYIIAALVIVIPILFYLIYSAGNRQPKKKKPRKKKDLIETIEDSE